ncbi:sulfatase-like hydrolase/transferase [Thermomonospora echinospora]|uniref:sulfatase-like hydrolase/transferase n=1 Tax=Thermomonospora echinospora TaxID=1992 RepID=UPI000CDEED6E|nr:sulfatase-like hydrolase/transferase [Thermomonospora echinospora]
MPDDDATGEDADGRRDNADGQAGDRADRPRMARRGAAWTATALACVFVLSALIAPNEIGRLTPGAFVRVPLEGLLGAALLLVLPGRARKAAASLLGVVLGLLVIVKVVDIGFYATLDRPFRPMFDWSLLGAAMEFLGQSIGRAGAIGVMAAAVVLLVAVVVLMALSVLRLTRLAVRHGTAAARAVVVLGIVWVACAVLGAQLVPGVPVAAVAFDRVLQVREDLLEQRRLAAKAADDAFRGVPDDRLLTALRGKDVVFSFVESYGRDAIEDPRFASQVGAVLQEGDRRLRAAGYTSRSAFLTSPTAGGGSWLAHATLLSGLWIDNQQRHHDLVTGDRLTLTRAFRRAGWRTVAVMPGNTRPWPEGAFYGHQKVYNRPDLGYQGPPFNWDTPPDQYTLETFQRTERAGAGQAPVMAEIPLVSSHSPWAPTPRLVGWDDVGDGSVFAPIAAAGDQWQDVWRSPGRMRTAYRRSIEYTLSTLVSYVETYGGDDLVLVFLGDHQPAPIITGAGASRDVPITIVARDRAVLDRISGWGWQDGLKPGPNAPVWRMDAFRDRFLTAFGTSPAPG